MCWEKQNENDTTDIIVENNQRRSELCCFVRNVLLARYQFPLFFIEIQQHSKTIWWRFFTSLSFSLSSWNSVTLDKSCFLSGSVSVWKLSNTIDFRIPYLKYGLYGFKKVVKYHCNTWVLQRSRPFSPFSKRVR